MPTNVYGNSNSVNDNKIDASLFVQKPYLRSNYIEANIEEYIDLKNQYRYINLPDPISIREAAPKNCVDNKFNDPTIIKNSEHIDLSDRNITNARFIQVNQLPQINSHLTAKLYVDNSIDETSVVRNNRDTEFRKHNLTNINCITLNTQAVNDNHAFTKSYVDQFHQENERSRRDLGIDFYNESSDLVINDQDNDFNDNKLTNLDSITTDRNPTLDNEASNKKYIDDELDKITIFRFNQTLQNYLKVSVGSYTYNLTKYNKISITDITDIIFPNTGREILRKWNIYCNNKLNQQRMNDFIKSTRTNSPTSESGKMSQNQDQSIGHAFNYVETSSNNNGENVFFSLERTDIKQITKLTFYYNMISILTNDNLKAM